MTACGASEREYRPIHDIEVADRSPYSSRSVAGAATNGSGPWTRTHVSLLEAHGGCKKGAASRSDAARFGDP